MGLLDLFPKVGKIVDSYNDDSHQFGYNYNFVNGFTIYGAGDYPMDINTKNGTSRAYEISSRIHQELGGHIVVTIAPSVDYYNRRLANDYPTFYKLEDFKGDVDDDSLFMNPQTRIEE